MFVLLRLKTINKNKLRNKRSCSGAETFLKSKICVKTCTNLPVNQFLCTRMKLLLFKLLHAGSHTTTVLVQCPSAGVSWTFVSIKLSSAHCSFSSAERVWFWETDPSLNQNSRSSPVGALKADPDGPNCPISSRTLVDGDSGPVHVRLESRPSTSEPNVLPSEEDRWVLVCQSNPSGSNRNQLQSIMITNRKSTEIFKLKAPIRTFSTDRCRWVDGDGLTLCGSEKYCFFKWLKSFVVEMVPVNK